LKVIFSGDASDQQNKSDRGLCADCRHARVIQSDRSSIFLQCQLAFTNKNFVKYPRLPVRYCTGYKQAEAG
jgi:hypothetical protein